MLNGSNETSGLIDRRVSLAVLHQMETDPAIFLHEEGRQLLQLLSLHIDVVTNWSVISATIPDHRKRAIAEFFRRCAMELDTFAQDLREISYPPPSVNGRG